MDLFKMMKQAMSLKSKMKEMQAKLSGMHVDIDRDGVRVVVSCELKKVECSIDPQSMNYNAEKLSRIVSHNVQEALSKAKGIAAEELKKTVGISDLGGFSDLLQ